MCLLDLKVFKVLPVLKQNGVVVKPLDETKGVEVIIHNKEAVCKNCWKLIEENYGKKTNCQCEINLLHSCCEAAWSGQHGGRCPYCKQEAHSIPVTLSRGQASENFPKRNKNPRRGLLSCLNL
nr:E3 ubiquitin-protein like [Ipomoea batatas]